MIDLEVFSRLKNLVEEWEGKENYNVPAHVITEMFLVHNKIWWERQEHSRACGGCRQRVWGKLKGYYHENKDIYEAQLRNDKLDNLGI